MFLKSKLPIEIEASELVVAGRRYLVIDAEALGGLYEANHEITPTDDRSQAGKTPAGARRTPRPQTSVRKKSQPKSVATPPARPKRRWRGLARLRFSRC